MVIDQIETDWSMIHEPAHLVMRYASAVQKYLQALIHNHHDAEEVGQDFLLLVSKHGLPRLRQDRGRFRDYLKKCVRNAACNFLRRDHKTKLKELDIAQHAGGSETEIDEEWIGEWRRCVLDRAWGRLRRHEEQSRGSLACTVLRLHVDFPDESSDVLAEKVAALTGKPIRAEAFRQQLSRARRQFAQFLVDEVAQTLSDPEPASVEDELADLGLHQFVRNYLPLRRRGVSSSTPPPAPR
jgi:DNA-directed RNA polymerase specialized sigma24 family protein